MYRIARKDSVRVLAGIIKGLEIEILLIAAYLPTGCHTEKLIEYQETIDKICSYIEEYGKGRMVIIGGDWNVDLTRDKHSTLRENFTLFASMGG